MTAPADILCSLKSKSYHGSSSHGSMESQNETMVISASTAPFIQSWQSSSSQQTKSSDKTLQATPFQQALAMANLYRARDGYKASLAILGNYLTVAACIAFSQTVFASPRISAYLSTVIYLCSTLVIASRIRALEVLVHEASHNNLFASSSLHERLQFLYTFPVFRTLGDYRRSHLIHHKYLGDPTRDPDIQRMHKLGLDHLPERPLWLLFGVPMTGYLTYEYLTTDFYEFWKSRSLRVTKTAYWVMVLLTVLYVHAFQDLLYYFFVPFLIILPVIRYWAEASEHLGLDLTGDFGTSRTNLGFLQQWYTHPHNDGYHSVHHLHSQIPFYLLPQAHQRLMRESTEFKGKTVISHSMSEMFRQMARQRMIVKDVSGVSPATKL